MASDRLGRDVERAVDCIDRDVLRDLLVAMVDTPSPTGSERSLAEMLVQVVGDLGLESTLQPIDDLQANAIGRLRSRHADGPELMLYSPIDTHLSGEADDDVPQSSLRVEPLRTSRARVHGQEIAGLGAENPKGFAACIITAAHALARSDVELRGDLIVGLGAGGMPTNASSPGQRRNIGHGAGAAFMLQQGTRPDYAVIAKPVWAVSWEEVGVAWFRIRVQGTFGYAGIRHELPYRNALVDAAHVLLELETWLPTYSEAESDGLVAPQGVVGAISGGFPHKPTFFPAVCDLFLDMRVNPRSDPVIVKRALTRKVAEIRKLHPGLECEVEMLLAIPGSYTSPDSWIVQSLVRAWEHVEGRPHEPPRNGSGATDVAILRMWGIPTARLGIPHAAVGTEGPWAGDDPLPMNLVHLDDCVCLVEALVRAAVDTCGRSLAETSARSSACA